MAHKSALNSFILVLLISAVVLSGCISRAADPLPLESYSDPTGRYEFAIPAGWSSAVSADHSELTLSPPTFSDKPQDLRVYAFTAPTYSNDPNEHVAVANVLLEPFLAKYIDDSFEVINRGETKVDKRPAVIIDYAKPYEGSYLSGRLVIVAMPYYAVAFIGVADRQAWDAFLPTFKQMLAEFQLISIYEASATP